MSFIKMRWPAVTVAGVVLAVTAISPANAATAALTCGATITVDTTLHADLMNCPNLGIRIGADDITLNLNGHTIAGNGVPFNCSPHQTCDVGVYNRGHDGVAIVGGTVRAFGVGIYDRAVRHNRLRGLSVPHNTDFGIRVEGATDSVIDRTSMSSSGIFGMLMIDSRHMLVSRDSVSGSHGYAIFLIRVDDSVFQNNSLHGNDHGIGGETISRNIIRSNSVFRNGGSSIDFGNGSTGNRVESNRLTDNGDGILTNAYGTLISHNIITGTGFFGFPDTGGFSLLIDGGEHITVDGNIITGSRGPAIYVTSLDSPTASVNNVVSRNVVNSRLSDGILVDNGATGTRLLRNVAIGSGDDGIDVDAPATTLTGNIANRNHDFGIEAVPGVTNGGGNHAAGNGNPAQCVNIICHR